MGGPARDVRGRELEVPEWMTIPSGDRYAAATRAANSERARRRLAAGRAVVALAHELDNARRDPDHVPEEVRWELRGEPRSRATFAQAHPDDFSGGLPLPRA